MRTVRYRYIDPLDSIWLAAAHGMGLRVARSAACYASYDGMGTLVLSDTSGMDPDDCLAQMILHEICHALIQGPQSFGWVDWGLDNVSDRDREREHACLRLQAALLEPHGLRGMLAPTTDFRAYYDALPADPFAETHLEAQESIVLARAAFARRTRFPVAHHLETALSRTSRLLTELRSSGPTPFQDSLLSTAEIPARRHPSGLPMRHPAPSTCQSCVWATPSADGALVCQQAGGVRVMANDESCAHFEAPFDCLACGACCREAYDTVEVEQDDPAVALHLPLMVERETGYDLVRSGGRCGCLRGGRAVPPPVPSIAGGSEPADAGQRVPPLFLPNEEPFTCAIYETRPRTCREFAQYSEHCLTARRAVGLSR